MTLILIHNTTKNNNNTMNKLCPKLYHLRTTCALWRNSCRCVLLKTISNNTFEDMSMCDFCKLSNIVGKISRLSNASTKCYICYDFCLGIPSQESRCFSQESARENISSWPIGRFLRLWVHYVIVSLIVNLT